MMLSINRGAVQSSAGPVLRTTPYAAPVTRPSHARRRQGVQIRAFRVSEQESSNGNLANSDPIHPVNSSLSAVTELVAQPSITWSCLTGFCLVAAGVFAPAIDTDPSSGSNDQASFARSMLQMLSNGGAAAQAAAGDTGSVLLQAPTAAEQLVALPAAESATQQIPHMVSAVASSPILDFDQAVHNFVVSHTSYSWRAMAADIYISDSFIAAGIVGWLLCTAICLATHAKKAAGPLALSWAFYFMTCGAIGTGDPWLVNLLKNTFGRVRPSPMHHTFSFPSGHTSAAVFIAGGLVAVLLPLTMQVLVEKGVLQSSNTIQSSSKIDGGGVSEQSNARHGNGSWSSLSRVDLAALGCWGAAWGTTAAGRVLADAHWVSDTLAGGLLSVAVVSALAQSAQLLQSVTAVTSSSKTD